LLLRPLPWGERIEVRGVDVIHPYYPRSILLDSPYGNICAGLVDCDDVG
jgi:hypothetical protein